MILRFIPPLFDAQLNREVLQSYQHMENMKSSSNNLHKNKSFKNLELSLIPVLSFKTFHHAGKRCDQWEAI
jgi:hypothetical protein